jgi:phospholipid/cholesterol/gamma-HCH transport system substrate-binding protein
MRRRLGLAGLGAAAVLLLSGCEFNGLYGAPLPGGADLGDHSYEITAKFADVLDLVPQAAVRVNDVPVGSVSAIKLDPKDHWVADVTLRINGDVKLPANATATLNQSSLLGEKFVQLVAPATGEGTGSLKNGAVIELNHTSRNVEVEEVLGALSMLLNGGGVQQLQTINKEINNATRGNEEQLRAMLANVNTLVTGLDAHSGDITKAIDGLNRLAGTLNQQRDQIAGVIDNIGPGLQVLNQQRDQLVAMLSALKNLSGVTIDTLNRSKADLVADLQALTPTLQKLAQAGNDLPNALQLLLTYPFPDYAVNGIRGDYENLFIKLDLNLQTVLDNLGRSRQNPLAALPIPGIQGLTGGTTGSPSLPLPAAPSTQRYGTSGPPDLLGGLLAPITGGGR